jgi:hypothetical protein
MHKRIISVILIFTLIICLTPAVTAATEDYSGVELPDAEGGGIPVSLEELYTPEEIAEMEAQKSQTRYISSEQANKEAEDLKSLGLFLGSDKGFELERAPTRLEGLIMLVRLMGEDASAKECSYTHPFKDVPAWGDRYVAWAYNKGYTSGTSATTFSPNNKMMPAEYFAFVLRALGYGDDFKWPYSTEKAREIELIPSDAYSDITVPFLRADVVHISYLALKTRVGGPEGEYLYYALFSNGAIDVKTALEIFKPEGTELEIIEEGNNRTYRYVTKRYSYTNTNNKMSYCTISINGDTLTVNGVETGAADSINLSFGELTSWNDLSAGPKVEWLVKKKLPFASAKYSDSLTIPAFKFGEYFEVLVSAASGDESTEVMGLIIKGEPGKWYFEVPDNDAANDELLSSENDTPVSQWLDDAPTGTLADKIRSVMPRASESDYDTAENIFMWVSQNIKWEGDIFGVSEDDVGVVLENKKASSEGISNLMISALNLYGIPARRVNGEVEYTFGLGMNLKGVTKDIISYAYEIKEHYWVEFLDENNNWIVCDPTIGTFIAPNAWFDVNRDYAANILRSFYYK